MKKLFHKAVITGLMLAWGSTMAHAEVKIGIVRLQEAINTVEEGKRAKANFQKEVQTKQAELENKKKELMDQRNKLEKDKVVLSQEAFNAKAAELQTKLLEWQKMSVDYTKQMQQKESDSIAKILVKMKSYVDKVASEKGLTLVIENSADVVVYQKDALDITPDVVAAYNKGGK